MTRFSAHYFHASIEVVEGCAELCNLARVGFYLVFFAKEGFEATCGMNKFKNGKNCRWVT